MSPDKSSDERQRVEVEVASRLRSRGVHLTERETADELVELLEAVERFERVVERGGGDLMVDEPIGGAQAGEPDNPGFVLPPRGAGESVRGYLGRIAEATRRAATRRP
jgi:hypothetical protein